jgi:hypothetical protein
MWLVKASSFRRHHFSEVNSSSLYRNAGQCFGTVGLRLQVRHGVASAFRLPHSAFRNPHSAFSSHPPR